MLARLLLLKHNDSARISPNQEIMILSDYFHATVLHSTPTAERFPRIPNALLLWREKHFKMSFFNPHRFHFLRLVYREMDIVTSDDPIIGHAIIL